jgi:membrane-bound metal-dependent hydrolase YbcI (DUF457 family)
MLVGHIAVGLAAKALEPRMKLGTMLAAALLLDIVFFLLMLSGVESITQGHVSTALHIDFPYSHSLVSAAFLSLAAGMVWALWGGRRARRHGVYWDGIALIVAIVFSHWLLDFIVHSSDMPLYPGGEGLGLGLSRYQPVALLVELALTALGFTAFALRSPLQWGRKIAVAIMVAVVAAFTIEEAYNQATLPEPIITALASLTLIAVAIAVAAWADASKSRRLTRLSG